MSKIIPGINIQWPWSELLLSGKKTVETRSYSLPKKFVGIELAIIETPGKRGKKEAGIEKARIIGSITFGKSFEYETERKWKSDHSRHCVDINDPQFSWQKRQSVWGWEVLKIERFPRALKPPQKRGIVFATACRV